MDTDEGDDKYDTDFDTDIGYDTEKERINHQNTNTSIQLHALPKLSDHYSANCNDIPKPEKDRNKP